MIELTLADKKHPAIIKKKKPMITEAQSYVGGNNIWKSSMK